MKIIASDYDGTLNMGGVSEANKAAIKAWQEKGNLFGLVSGRALKDAILLAQRDGIKYDFYIAATGASIANSEGEILKRTTFSIDTVKKLAKLAEKKGRKHLVFVCDHERKWLFFDSEEAGKHERETMTYEELDNYGYACQVSLACPTSEEAAELTAAIAEHFKGVLNPAQNGGCIDIVAHGMDKAVGILKYCEIAGLSEDDVITAGDNYNDLAMIRRFEGCAVGRAVEPLIEAAKHRYMTVDELIKDFL